MQEVWGLNPGSVKFAKCRQRLATGATFFWCSVAQALSCADGPGTCYTLRHNATSINKDLIFDLVLLLDLYFYFIHSTVVIYFGDISIGISWKDL